MTRQDDPQPDHHQQLLISFYIPGVQLCWCMNQAVLTLADLGMVDQPDPRQLWVFGGVALLAALFALKRRAAAK